MTFRGSEFGGPRRGEWQRRGHGPDGAFGYAWEYRGGAGRDSTVMRTEAGMGPRGSYGARLDEPRGGGLPRGRERFGGSRMVGDASRGAGRYDRGLRRYGRDFDDDRPPLADSFARVQRLERDPRWRGDSQQIRRQLETGPGRIRWSHSDHYRGTGGRGIPVDYDGGFRF